MLKVAYLNELEKLAYRKKYVVFLILDAVCCLLMALTQLFAELVSDGVFSTDGMFDSMMFSGFSWYTMLFIPLMSILACADLFSGEFHDLSIRMVLQRPVERWKIFFAKIAAVFTLCSIYVFAHFIFMFLVKLGFGQTMVGTGYAFCAYLLDLIPIAVTICLFALLHQLVKSPGSAVALSVVVFAVLICIGKYVTFCGGLIFTEYLSWHTMWLGTLLPFSVFLPKLGILLGTGVMLYCLGYELFDRKEI